MKCLKLKTILTVVFAITLSCYAQTTTINQVMSTVEGPTDATSTGSEELTTDFDDCNFTSTPEPSHWYDNSTEIALVVCAINVVMIAIAGPLLVLSYRQVQKKW